MTNIKLTKEEAIKVAVNEAIKLGAGKQDLTVMEKVIRSEDDNYYFISIYPAPGGRQNFDFSIKINKKTGKIEGNTVMGTLIPPPKLD